MLYNSTHVLRHYELTFSVLVSKPPQATGTIVNQVSVVLIVNTDACMQRFQGSNPADRWKVLMRSAAFFTVI